MTSAPNRRASPRSWIPPVTSLESPAGVSRGSSLSETSPGGVAKRRMPASSRMSGKRPGSGTATATAWSADSRVSSRMSATSAPLQVAVWLAKRILTGRDRHRTRVYLLDLHRRAGLLEVGLELVGLVALQALLDGPGRLVDESLRLLEAEAGRRAD